MLSLNCLCSFQDIPEPLKEIEGSNPSNVYENMLKNPLGYFDLESENQELPVSADLKKIKIQKNSKKVPKVDPKQQTLSTFIKKKE